MGTLRVVVLEKHIQVALHRLERVVEALAKDHAIELIEQSLVEPLADPVGLRALRLPP